MGKPTICIGESKGADRLRSNCEADQRLCVRYTDITIPLLSESKISSLLPSSVTVQPGLCRTWSKPKLLVFSRTGSFHLFGKTNMETYIACKRNSDKKHQTTGKDIDKSSSLRELFREYIY